MSMSMLDTSTDPSEAVEAASGLWRTNLQHYDLPDELKREIERFVQYHNHRRYHESLDNLTSCRCVLW